MIRVHQGDCVGVMASLSDDSIDVCVCSPPYNLGVPYTSYDDDRPYADYLAWTETWVQEVARVLHQDGSVFVIVADLPRNPHLSSDVVRIAQDAGFVTQNKIVWVKSVHVKGRTHGHLRPTTSPRYLDVTHEHVLHLTKRGDVPIDRHAEGVGVPYADKSNETRYKHRNKLRCPGSVWYVPQPTRNGRARHPAAFPVKLAEKCLRLHGVREGLKVLDPFGGSGTVGVAAKRCGCDCTLIELDPGYCEHARRRVEAASDLVQRVMF